MLGDTTSFAFSHIGMPDSIQQGGLPMVNMPKDGYYRGSVYQLCWILFEDYAAPKRYLASLFFLDLFLLLNLRCIPQFGGNDSRRIKINLLINARHHAIRHQNLDDLHSAGIELIRQLAYAHTVWECYCFLPVIAHIPPHFFYS